jgi:predicted metal-dependent hydrolase
MTQVREEQHSRQAMIRALMTEQAVSVAIPTDKEVNERIKELQEVLRKSLTKNTHGGKI